MKRIVIFVLSLLLGAAFATPPDAEVSSAREATQCRRADTPIRKQLRFARGRTTAVIKDTVRLCTSHEYNLRARAGQTMSVHLVTGNRTSFTVYTPSDRIEEADGVKDWTGELPEDGEYQITIGTDATAAYTLEVTIR